MLRPCPVSTQEQKKHGLSVDNQITALEAFCKDNGYICAGIYNDAGISAHASYKKRPALLQMIRDCQRGDIDLIIMTKLDRFFRSVKDYYEVMAQIGDVPWRAIWEDYETETSAGMFKVNIMLSIAQAEAERTSERIHNTFEYKRAKGDYLGTPPFGYIRVDGKLQKDEALAPIVRGAFDVYLRTHSTADVMRYLTAQGHPSSRHRVSRLLYGTAYKGDANGSKCEPYITEEEYSTIMKIKESKYRAPKYKNTYLFNTMCKCGICGYSMRAQGNMSKDKKTFYPQYGCNGLNGLKQHEKGFYISEKKLEAYLLQYTDELLAEYRASAESKAKNDSYKNALQNKKKLEDKLSRIGIRFEMGDISVDEYKNKREAILNEIASLDLQPPKTSNIVIPDNWRDIYDQLDREHQHEFWFSFIEKIEVNPDKTIKVYFL